MLFNVRNLAIAFGTCLMLFAMNTSFAGTRNSTLPGEEEKSAYYGPITYEEHLAQEAAKLQDAELSKSLPSKAAHKMSNALNSLDLLLVMESPETKGIYTSAPLKGAEEPPQSSSWTATFKSVIGYAYETGKSLLGKLSKATMYYYEPAQSFAKDHPYLASSLAAGGLVLVGPAYAVVFGANAVIGTALYQNIDLSADDEDNEMITAATYKAARFINNAGSAVGSYVNFETDPENDLMARTARGTAHMLGNAAQGASSMMAWSAKKVMAALPGTDNVAAVMEQYGIKPPDMTPVLETLGKVSRVVDFMGANPGLSLHDAVMLLLASDIIH